MAEGGLHLRKWRTNDQTLTSLIEEKQETSEQKNVGQLEQTYAQTTLACQAGGQGQKVLGL